MTDCTHGGNHAPLPVGVWLDPGYCHACDNARHGSPTSTDHCPRRQCRGRLPHSWLIHWFGWVRR